MNWRNRIMITNQQIEELNVVINYLNQVESLSDEDLADKVENIKSLAKTLTRVKVSKIKKLINNNSTESKELEQISYTRDSVIQLFANSKSEDILKSHTLSQLKEMFIAVYGQKPLSKDTKEDIISAIKKMIQQIDRATGFKELDNND